MSISLKIPSPCNQDLSKMPRSNQGFYCSNCRKNVIDFSLKSDEEILRLLENNNGDICGVFYSDQLDKPLANEVAKQKTSFFRNIFSGLFLYFTPLLAIGQSKKNVSEIKNEYQQQGNQDENIIIDSAKQVLEPIVVVSKVTYKRSYLTMGGLVIVKDETTKDKCKKKWWMFWKKKKG